jgi:hypothetical protein
MAADLKELRQLVRNGKLFAVQKWIADGKRTPFLRSQKFRSPQPAILTEILALLTEAIASG